MENMSSSLTTSNISLIIQGLALCHFNNGIWKIFFPRVRGHNFKLLISKKFGYEDQDVSVFELPPATKINFSIDNTANNATIDPAQWQDAVDLSRLHGEPLCLVDDQRKYAGVLTMHGGSLVSKKARRAEKFQIWEATETAKSLIGETVPANIFASEFQLASGSAAKITVQNDFGFNFSLPQEKDISYKIIIFNDCDGANCERILDFRYLYNIINVDEFEKKRFFELIAHDGGRGFPGSRCGGSAGSGIINPDVI